MIRSREDRRRARPGLLAALALVIAGRGWSVAAEPAARSAVWSPYAPVSSPAPPSVADPEWSESPLDSFVLASLTERGLRPAPAIDRRAWIRRVTFDLIGLPPTPEDVEAFLADSRSDAEARAAVADALLASPEHGVRWARHWLDVVRYADSDGFAIDSERPTLWRYRDYVVRSLNADKPFDRFLKEQIAGDLLDGGTDGLVATGFYRLGPWEADNMVAELRRQDFLNEVTSTVGSAFLGLSFGCARCHDHKYDPIPTRDFYRLQAFFTPFDRAERGAAFVPEELTPAVVAAREAVRSELERRKAAHAAFRSELRAKLAKASSVDLTAITDEALEKSLKDEKPFTREEKARHEELRKAWTDYTPQARFAETAVTIQSAQTDQKSVLTHVLLGGNVTSPGEEVSPGFPTVVSLSPGAVPIRGEADKTKPTPALDRKALAAWLASPSNPLVPRVMVNRVWQHHMGRGIVATSNDFGKNGSGASHPELLDFLVRGFLADGMRLKPLHRMIVLSRAYRTSPAHPEDAACEKVDPENRLLWRGHYRRLEAEALRDSLLAVSGRLLTDHGGPGFYEELPQELGRSFPFFEWNPSSERERRRRSLFIFQRRNLVVPMLEAFDAADATESCDRRRSSVTAPQVLSLLNGKLANDSARRFAMRVMGEVGTDAEAQVVRAFWIALSRPPTSDELSDVTSILRAKLERRREGLGQARGKTELIEAEVSALSDICLVLLNSNEFLYLE